MDSLSRKIVVVLIFYFLLLMELISQFNFVFAEETKQNKATISGVVSLGSYEEILGKEVAGLIMVFDKNPLLCQKHRNIIPTPIVMKVTVAMSDSGTFIEHPLFDYSRESKYTVVNLPTGKMYYIICFPVFGIRPYCLAPELNLGAIPIELTKNKAGINIRFYSYEKLSEVPRITVTNISKILRESVSQSDINTASKKNSISNVEKSSISGKVILDRGLVSAKTIFLVMAFEGDAIKGFRSLRELFFLPNIPNPASITVVDSRSGKYVLNGLCVGKTYFVFSLLALQEEKNYWGEKVASLFLNDNVSEINFKFSGEIKKASISGRVLKEPGIFCSGTTDILVFDMYPRYIGNRIPKPIKEVKISDREEYIIFDLPINKTYYIIARNIPNELVGSCGVMREEGMELTPIRFDKEQRGVNIHLYRKEGTEESSLSDTKEVFRRLLKVAAISGTVSADQTDIKGGITTIAVFEEHPSRATGMHQNYFTEIEIPSPGIGNYVIYGLPTGRKYYIVARHKGIKRETGYGVVDKDGYLKLIPIELNNNIAGIDLEFKVTDEK